jgi:hypothetical protein
VRNSPLPELGEWESGEKFAAQGKNTEFGFRIGRNASRRKCEPESSMDHRSKGYRISGLP